MSRPKLVSREESGRKYREKNKDKIKAYHSSPENKEKRKIRRLKRKDIVNANQRAWRTKNPERSKAIVKRSYIRNSWKYKIAYKENRLQWWIIFQEMGLATCCRCGYNKCHEAIEFHHLDPNIKETNITNLLPKKITDKKRKQVLDEINKCIVLCANCHREEHYKLKNYETADAAFGIERIKDEREIQIPR